MSSSPQTEWEQTRPSDSASEKLQLGLAHRGLDSDRDHSVWPELDPLRLEVEPVMVLNNESIASDGKSIKRSRKSQKVEKKTKNVKNKVKKNVEM